MYPAIETNQLWGFANQARGFVNTRKVIKRINTPSHIVNSTKIELGELRDSFTPVPTGEDFRIPRVVEEAADVVIWLFQLIDTISDATIHQIEEQITAILEIGTPVSIELLEQIAQRLTPENQVDTVALLSHTLAFLIQKSIPPEAVSIKIDYNELRFPRDVFDIDVPEDQVEQYFLKAYLSCKERERNLDLKIGVLYPRLQDNMTRVRE